MVRLQAYSGASGVDCGQGTRYGLVDEQVVNQKAHRGIGEKMEIHLNISFPRIPCELLTLDVMDVSGEQQTGVMHGVNKVRLGPVSEGSHVIESKALDLSVFPTFYTV